MFETVHETRTKWVRLTIAALMLLPIHTARAQAPENDKLENATVIQGVYFGDIFDTTQATVDWTDPLCGPNHYTVWYTFTPEFDAQFEAFTLGQDSVSVYTNPPGPDTQVACAGIPDEEGQVPHVNFDATVGETYYIMVGGIFGGGIAFNFWLVGEPLELTHEIDHSGTIDPQTGEASVSGTLYCSHPAVVEVSGALVQPWNHFLIHGSFGEALYCEDAVDWDFSGILGENGVFKGGKATVNIGETAMDIKLKGGG